LGNKIALKGLMEDIAYKCAQCGYCNALCPIYHQVPWESYSPRGKIFLLKKLQEGKYTIHQEFSERVLQCTLCMKCESSCMLDLKLYEFWKEIRAELYNQQLYPKEVYSYVSNLKKSKNVLGMSRASSIISANRKIRVDRKAEVGYFVGCLASYLPQLRSTVTSLIDIFEKSNVDYTVLSDEWCCGNPLFQIGDVEGAREFAEHNVAEFEKLGVQRVVTTCAGCYRTLKVEYPRLLGSKLPFEVLHSSEFLLHLLEDGKIQLKGLELKVTWHDPCELGRGAGVYDPPRKVLQSIPGVKFVEFENNRENSTCCGGGGLLPVTYPKLSSSLAVNRVAEALPLGVDAIVTGCSTCLLNLSGGVKKLKKNIQVLDLVELVDKAYQKAKVNGEAYI